MTQPDKKEESWKIKFGRWWDNHKNFMGGLDSGLVPALEDFIRQTIKEEKLELLEEIVKKLKPDIENGKMTVNDWQLAGAYYKFLEDYELKAQSLKQQIEKE